MEPDSRADETDPRRFSIGKVLDLSWVVWRKDFYLFWGVTAFVLMPLALADGLVERWIDPDLANLVAPLRSFANVLFASLVSSGLMAMAVVGRLKGQPATAIQIVAVARFRPSSLMSVVTTVLLLLPAFCALVVPGIVLHVRWLLVGPIAALERHQSPRGRSTALTAGHRSALFGLILLTNVGGRIITGLVGALPDDGTTTGWIWRLLVLSAVISFQAVCVCVSYHQLRLVEAVSSARPETLAAARPPAREDPPG